MRNAVPTAFASEKHTNAEIDTNILAINQVESHLGKSTTSTSYQEPRLISSQPSLTMSANPKPDSATSTHFAPPLPPEILGPRLIEVPIRDILVCVQRVCKAWHALVADSKRLQEALHFRPVTAESLKLKSPADLSSTTPVKLIYRGLIVHPVLGSFLWDNTFNLNRAALSEPTARWRRALATQPALKDLRMFGVRVYAKDMAIGVTVQDVVDVMGWEKERWEVGFERYDRSKLHRPRWHIDMAWEFQERIQWMMELKAEEKSAKVEIKSAKAEKKSAWDDTAKEEYDQNGLGSQPRPVKWFW